METKLNINDKKGIFTALLTPFDKNNKINAKALEELIKFNVKMGVNGFYVTGSTGEAFLLSTEYAYHITVYARCKCFCKGFILGAGANLFAISIPGA